MAKSLVVLRAWDDRVIDASPELGVRGIDPGDSRRRVQQLCPDAIILSAREVAGLHFLAFAILMLRRFVDVMAHLL